MAFTTAEQYNNDIPANLAARVAQALSLEIFFGAGAAADTNIPISGLKTTAIIKKALHIAEGATAGAAIADLTAEAVILTAGNLQFTDTSTATTNSKILVIYYNT